jgi:SAM-dependent methyltransferase
MLQETINTYNLVGSEYPEGDISLTEARWIEHALGGQKRGSLVFEFGSGLGARSRFIEELGFRVQRSDVTGAFLEHLKDSSPMPMLLDLLEDPLPTSDIFYAAAVLLHFPKERVPGVLEKIYKATSPGGLFFFSLKEGDGETVIDDGWGPRFFAFWRKEEILAALMDAGWERVELSQALSSKGDNMLQIIARKI